LRGRSTRRRRGGWGGQGIRYGLEHSLGLSEHLEVPEAQDGKALDFEPVGAPSIVLSLVSVLATVDLATSLRSRQTKSTMNGPSGCWRRNLWPSTWRLRNLAHRARSASVMSLRSCLERSRFISLLGNE
jgi:hypothetical protein